MKTAVLLLVCLVPGAGFFQEFQCPAPGCKTQLKADAKFCPTCGEKILRRACAGCKAALPPAAKFCAGCGAKVEEAPAPKGDAPKAEAPRPAGQEPDAVKERRGDELEKFGVTAEQINRAIDRGAAFLARQYAKREFTNEEDYLTAYALIHTQQYYANGKLRDKINAFLRGDAWLKGNHVVYTAGVRALALEATRDPDLRALARECAEYLVEAQGPKGTWSYKAEVPIAAAAAPMAAESGVSVSGGEPLDEEVKVEDLKRKGTCKNPGDGDNSCTQFAVLGLHAASKCGVRVPREVWDRCLKEMERRGCEDGGWHYHGAARESYGSMTCAGVCSVALCRYYLGEKDYLAHPKVQSGIQWLAKNFSVKVNPKGGNWPLYYLYSVERVGVFTASETIGEHRWYPLGAKHLVDSQGKDGSWSAEGDHEKSTSYALLFLTRATAPVKAQKRGGKGVLETHVLNDTTNFHFILDASGSMREEVDGKEKFEIAKEVVESIVKKLPEGTHVGLRVYGHRYLSLDDKAETDSELLVPIGPVRHAEFLAKVRALKCKGKTPITHSLGEAVRDLGSVEADLDLITVLLTDGGESTRGAKPAEAAARLAASRKGMKLHVVGFDINQDDWREQLEATAAAGGGKYFHALKASELLGALSLAAMGQAEYVVKDRGGKEAARGRLGDRHDLPEGKYAFAVTIEGKTEEKTVWINTEVTSHVSVSLSKFQKK